MSHDHGGGSQDYVGMGKSVSCSMTDAIGRWGKQRYSLLTM